MLEFQNHDFERAHSHLEWEGRKELVGEKVLKAFEPKHEIRIIGGNIMLILKDLKNGLPPPVDL